MTTTTREEVPSRSTRCGECLDPGGRFVIVRRVGTGGMGTVYEVRDRRRGHRYAAKFLHAEMQRDAEARRRFRREGRRFRELAHPNLVRIHGLGRRVDGQCFVLSEFIDGEDLVAVLARGAMPDVRRALEIGRDVARAVHALHGARIIHRDLKPENVMIRHADGRVKVLDFGVAKHFGAASFSTSNGEILGTPGYIAPEYLRGDRLDQRADVFSLGAILYELLTGKRCFEARRPSEILKLNRRGRPTPLHKVDPDVARPVADLIRSMLSRRPSRRPRTMLEVVRRIEGALAALERDEESRAGLGRFLTAIFES